MLKHTLAPDQLPCKSSALTGYAFSAYPEDLCQMRRHCWLCCWVKNELFYSKATQHLILWLTSKCHNTPDKLPSSMGSKYWHLGSFTTASPSKIRFLTLPRNSFWSCLSLTRDHGFMSSAVYDHHTSLLHLKPFASWMGLANSVIPAFKRSA